MLSEFVRVRVIFQNTNPKTLFDVLDIVSAVRTPPEARAVRVRLILRALMWVIVPFGQTRTTADKHNQDLPCF